MNEMSELIYKFGKKGITFFINKKPEKGRGDRLILTMLVKSKDISFQKKIKIKVDELEKINSFKTNEEKIYFSKKLFDGRKNLNYVFKE